MAITQTGSALRFATLGKTNTGTVSSTITVPADAELVLAGITSYNGTANTFSGGAMTMTKGGVDTAMTVAVTGASGGDNNTGAWMGALFYQTLPDTGSNKTMKWDWVGTGTTAEDTLVGITFWKGIDTSSPVRHALGAQNTSNTPYTTGTLTAQSGDLIVAWVAGFVTSEGTIDSWSNLTELSQFTQANGGDAAWATGSPSGNTTVAASTDTNFQDGAIVAIVLKPASAGGDHPMMRRWGGVPGMMPGGFRIGRGW